MPKLIMCQGLPGSGKSTWAIDHSKRHSGQCVIICKDDIRAWLEKATSWTWSPEREQDVIVRRDAEIATAFINGVDLVISADTNFGKHEKALRKLATDFGATFEIKDFTRVPLSTCIERDAKRAKPVGSDVIKKMYNKYIATETPLIEVYKPNVSKPRALICDLDGTLAIHNGRSPFDYVKCESDLVCEPVAEMLRSYRFRGYDLLYVSGREDWARAQTQNFLLKHGLQVTPDRLLMRPSNDFRKDDIIKLELFNQHIRHNYNVQFVIDDRPRVLRMWRALGLFTFAVGDLKEF